MISRAHFETAFMIEAHLPEVNKCQLESLTLRDTVRHRAIVTFQLVLLLTLGAFS
jgi:hypothetical protein